eukprot:TRINITY_DN15083_c0_g1_i1.p1 TRINITY_DN15083_c0_g1~~TRINITY_DN15083_c0_g1_i1.p1  ORF type:complete len:1040 (+),score=251.06 TRINITY_DN15083_c0_g1_i1:136-3255(+)
MRNRSPSRSKDSKEDTEIYVGNINAQTPVEPEDLKRLFEIAGTVNNVRIEKSNSKDTHFAFITFSSVEEAEQGCLYDGFKYHALSLKVQRKGRPGPPKLASPPSDDFTRKLKELQEQENTDLYLTNLNTADASEEVLHDTFSAFGDVRRVHLHGDPSNPSRPAFITFSRPEQVQRAVDAMDGKEFLGNTLGVCKARVGQRFWAIEAASKKSTENDKDKDEKKDKAAIDKNGKRGGNSSSSSGSKDDKEKDKDRKRRGRELKEKEESRKDKEPLKEEKVPAGRTPPTKSISTPTTKPAQGCSSAPSSVGSTSLKPTAKPAVAQPPTTIKTGKAAAATTPTAPPPQLSTPPQDPSDPSSVLEAILAGLERTRIADKEKNIGLYCSTDSYGVPTMVLPTAGERVCNALITVAQSLRRELQKLNEQHEAVNSSLKTELEQTQQRLSDVGQECSEVKEAYYTNQEAATELARLRSQRDQFASLRLVNLKLDTMAKDIAQLCSQFGTVQHVAMLGSVAHVTFCTPVDYQEVAAQLTSQIGGHQAEACYHSSTVATDVTKQSQPVHLPNSVGNGPVADHLNPHQQQQPQQQGPIDPMMTPAFPSLPLAGSGLNPNASSYKGAAHYGQGNHQVSQHPKSPQHHQHHQPHGKAQTLASHQPNQRPVPQEGVCIVCSKIGLQVCSVCMKTYYCGSECQARDWPDAGQVLTMRDAFKTVQGVNVTYVRGAEITGTDTSGIPEAVALVNNNITDVVVIGLGDSGGTVGEATDRLELDVAGVQLDLLKAVLDTGKEVVLVLINGRVQTFGESSNSRYGPRNALLAYPNLSVLEAWLPGEQGGPAIVDVLLGNVQPTGRLAQPFPACVGQIHAWTVPWFHQRQGDYGIGRGSPFTTKPREPAVSGSWDPIWCFGYGLGYSNYTMSGFRVSSTTLTPTSNFTATVVVTEKPPVVTPQGAFTLQIYSMQMSASKQVRDELNLIGFQKEFIPADGSAHPITVSMNVEDMGYTTWNPATGGHVTGTEVGQYMIFACYSACNCPMNVTINVVSAAHGR